MSNPHAKRYAIARAKARKSATLVADSASKPSIAPTDAAPRTSMAPNRVHLDLQSATMREGRTKGGQAYVSFFEGGQPMIVGFGRIADSMKRDRLAKGMAVRERGMLKIIAISEGGTLVDERGAAWRPAA